MKKNKISLIIILIIIFLALGFLGYLSKKQEDDNYKLEETKSEVTEEELYQNLVEEIDNLTYQDIQNDKENLYIYKDINNIYCEFNEETCNVPALKVKISNAKFQNIQKNRYIIINTDTINILDTKTKTFKYSKIPYKKGSNITYYYNEKEEIIGIVFFTNENTVKLLNISTNKILYQNENFESIELLSDKYAEAKKNNEKYLISTINEKEYLKVLNNQILKTFNYNDKDLIILEKPLKTWSSLSSNMTNFDKYFSVDLYKDENLIQTDIGLYNIYNNKIYTLKNEKITIYDFDGKIITARELKTDEETDINYDLIYKLMFNNYIFVTENKINIINLDTFEETTLCELKDNEHIYTINSYRYKDSETYERQSGIDIVIYDENRSGLYAPDEGFEIFYDIETGTIERKERNKIGY